MFKSSIKLLFFNVIIYSQGQIGSDLNAEAANDEFGGAVTVSEDGSIIAVGAAKNDGGGADAGHVRVYQYASSSWSQLGGDIDGEAAGDRSGTSISLSDDGSIIAIGSRLNDGGGSNFGHVRVYQYASSSWSQLGSDIDGEAANDFSGECVSLSGDGTIVAISAKNNDGGGTNAGHVRVYQYASSSWSQLGSDIDGEAANDKSGDGISLSDDGTILAVGAYYNDGNGSSSGHVRVYQYASSSWSQLGSDIDGEAANDLSGYGVSLSDDGTILAVGAYRNDGGGTDAGHARVYAYSGSSWSQLGSDIDGEAAGDNFGHSVSLDSDGDRVAIGALYNDGTGTDAGHARVYAYNGSNWIQLGSDIDGEAAGDNFGEKISLNGDGFRVIIGAPENDGTGNAAGHARAYSGFGLNSSYVTDIEAIWSASGTSASDASDGLTMTVSSALSTGNFAVFGNNNTNGTSTSDLGSVGSTNRTGRIWQVDESGTVAGTITIDISDATGNAGQSGTASNFRLLYRSGTSGDFSSAATGASISGDAVSFTSVSLADGYYALGSESDASLPVELTSFEVLDTRANGITLHWITESEINNLGFILDRRTPTIDWIEIASFVTDTELQGQGSVSHQTIYTYSDNTVTDDETYDYRIADVDYDGNKEYHSLQLMGISPASIPSTYVLHQNYPNPFNPVTTLSYDLPEDAMVNITIYDMMGRIVNNLVSSRQAAGYKSIQWNATNDEDKPVSAGLYLYTIQAGQFRQTKKMVLLK
jgi:hypothetical protein